MKQDFHARQGFRTILFEGAANDRRTNFFYRNATRPNVAVQSRIEVAIAAIVQLP